MRRPIATDIASFLDTYRGSLPPRAVSELEHFLREERPRIDAKLSGFHGVQVGLSALAGLRSALEYYLSDFSVVARRRTERAFVHLQQVIIADNSVREEWTQAYARDEPSCERLGGAHLLLHGIWGFKAHGPGARTDLILGEPVTDASAIERVADALVLTEWKVVRATSDAAAIAQTASRQAQMYGSGLLSGIELASYRYIVLVSQERVERLPDVILDQVTYRHINIAVKPSTPSKAAKSDT